MKKHVVDQERRSLLQIHDTLFKTTDSIIRSTQIAIETEGIGTEVLTELDQQGQQLKRVTRTVNFVNKFRFIYNIF
jgi:hypothetical protein